MPHATVPKLPGLLITFSPLSALAVAQEQGKPNQAHKPAAAKQDQTVLDKAANNSADYVRMDTCKTCHEDFYARLRSMP
jgi:cytochrome c5